MLIERNPVQSLKSLTPESFHELQAMEMVGIWNTLRGTGTTIVFDWNGLLALAWKKLNGFFSSDRLSWWLLWQGEKSLQQLLVWADVNPKDATKQSALMAELNKHNPEAVIKCFEQWEHAMDSQSVVDYL